MARIQLQLPDTFLFKTEIAVRISDLNYGGHVGNDSLLTLMQEARIAFYRSLGFESEIKLEGDTGQIIADAAVVYQSESFYGDILVIEIAAVDITKYGFDLFYRVTNRETGKGVAIGKTGIVCFDYRRRKIASVPPAVAARLQQ